MTCTSGAESAIYLLRHPVLPCLLHLARTGTDIGSGTGTGIGIGIGIGIGTHLAGARAQPPSEMKQQRR